MIINASFTPSHTRSSPPPYPHFCQTKPLWNLALALANRRLSAFFLAALSVSPRKFIVPRAYHSCTMNMTVSKQEWPPQTGTWFAATEELHQNHVASCVPTSSGHSRSKGDINWCISAAKTLLSTNTVIRQNLAIYSFAVKWESFDSIQEAASFIYNLTTHQ